VTRYPAQEAIGSDWKIPSILWYDPEGTVRAIGAEATKENIKEQAEEEGWLLAQWWKLHLRPKGPATSRQNTADIPPLPFKKTAVDVLADFMRYLYQCARSYIEETHANGKVLWTGVEDRIDFVLPHPNGWGGAQQSQIRRAAVLGGLIPDTEDGQKRIQLVTEGEASLHFCIDHGLAADAETTTQGIIVVDAGGGTVDLSAYYMTPSLSSFQEIAPTECLFQGSVLVTRRAQTFFERKLRGSKYGSPEDIASITSCFDKTTKVSFRDPDELSYVKFGMPRDKDLAFNIQVGRLKLLGSDVQALFEPSIQAIIDAIEAQHRAAREDILSIFLVGGFAANDWLFARLQAHFVPRQILFSRPDSHANKAVADGAVSFYLDHRVSVRVARWTYGTNCSVLYDPENPQHAARSNTVFSLPSGSRLVPKAFSKIIPKGTQVSEQKEFDSTYFMECSSLRDCYKIEQGIMCYRGFSEDPEWLDVDRHNYSTLCTVTANTFQMAQGLTPRRSQSGTFYYNMDFKIVLLFGLTELKAQISWIENGKEKRGPAEVVYDGERANCLK